MYRKLWKGSDIKTNTNASNVKKARNKAFSNLEVATMYQLMKVNTGPSSRFIYVLQETLFYAVGLIRKRTV